MSGSLKRPAGKRGLNTFLVVVSVSKIGKADPTVWYSRVVYYWCVPAKAIISRRFITSACNLGTRASSMPERQQKIRLQRRDRSPIACKICRRQKLKVRLDITFILAYPSCLSGSVKELIGEFAYDAKRRTYNVNTQILKPDNQFKRTLQQARL